MDAQRFALLNDVPASERDPDLLGVGSVANDLTALVMGSVQSAPFTIAVDAGWGMGKSTLMSLLRAKLDTRPGVCTVWYNAWTSTGEDALEGLIKSVLLKFDRRLLRRALHAMSSHRPVVRLLVAIGAVLASVFGGMFGVGGLVNELWKRFSVDAQARNRMRDAIKEIASKWAAVGPSGKPTRTLVVFIDDLDRCSEATVLAVCEAVKVYLDVPGIVFVVGCDRSALGPNGLLRDLGPVGSAFMEKIFQTSYRIPVPETTAIKEYIAKCAEMAGIQKLLNDDTISMIADRSARNPRRIKRLINGVVLESMLNPIWTKFDPEAVVKTLLLQYLYPDFYRTLVYSPQVADEFGHAITEVRAYRKVRQVLLQLVDQTDYNWAEVEKFFAEHEVTAPERTDRRAESLAELEKQLPIGFPELVVDNAFTSLIDELMATPKSEQFISRLRQRLPGDEIRELEVASEAPMPPSQAQIWGQPYDSNSAPQGSKFDSSPYGVQPQRPYGVQPQGAYGVQPQGPYGVHPQGPYAAQPSQSTGALPPFAGKIILWMDDNPTEAEDIAASHLRPLGFSVQVREKLSPATGMALLEKADLLISDIGTSGTDDEAGFRRLADWRAKSAYEGPAIFYTLRVTPARRARAAELGAEITNKPDVLISMVYDAMAQRSSPKE